MNQSNRIMHSPESALNLIGGNEVLKIEGYSQEDVDGYPMPESIIATGPVSVPGSRRSPEASQNSYGQLDVGDLLHELMSSFQSTSSHQPIDQGFMNDSIHVKQSLSSHRLMPVLYEVLTELKQRTALSPRLNRLHDEEHAPDAQLMRLDNMLIAEGVTEPPAGSNVAGSRPGQTDNAIEHFDYRSKLENIRKSYHATHKEYADMIQNFKTHVMHLIKDQSAARPITPKEADITARIIEKKLSVIEMQHKQMICEAVMSLRSKFLDARRKRRNFSKQASQILNDYFYNHLSNPYPSEEAKEELAKKCDITVSQVSNWFGNKRIRYKKNIGKSQEEANMYAAKQAAAAVNSRAARGSSSSPYPASSSHGTPTPIMSPAPSVSSQADLQAVYGMNLAGYPGHPYSGPPNLGYDPMNLQNLSPNSQ